MELVLPWYCFDVTSTDSDELDKILEDLSDMDAGRKIRCLNCEHVITYASQRISFAGSHTHDRINPGGIRYNFECFRTAPGCAVFGTATEEHTWFSGYKWQIAACHDCGEHLGWFFTGTGSLYGLIPERLIAENNC